MISYMYDIISYTAVVPVYLYVTYVTAGAAAGAVVQQNDEEGCHVSNIVIPVRATGDRRQETGSWHVRPNDGRIGPGPGMLSYHAVRTTAAVR